MIVEKTAGLPNFAESGNPDPGQENTFRKEQRTERTIPHRREEEHPLKGSQTKAFTIIHDE
jgi:hypothetical protein